SGAPRAVAYGALCWLLQQIHDCLAILHERAAGLDDQAIHEDLRRVETAALHLRTLVDDTSQWDPPGHSVDHPAVADSQQLRTTRSACASGTADQAASPPAATAP